MTLGTHLVKYGRYADAEPLLRRSHAAYVALESASFAAEAAVALAEALLGLAREADVESLLAPLLDKAPAPHDVTLRRRLATARVRMARFADAEPLLQAVWDGLPDGAERRAVAGEMVLLLEAWARVAPDPAREASLQSWRSRSGS